MVQNYVVLLERLLTRNSFTTFVTLQLRFWWLKFVIKITIVISGGYSSSHRVWQISVYLTGAGKVRGEDVTGAGKNNDYIFQTEIQLI